MYKNDILICNCSSVEHQIVIRKDEEDNIVYCEIHLMKLSFLKRLWKGIKYILGYKCKYGNFEEFIFSKEHGDKLIELGNFLKEKSEV